MDVPDPFDLELTVRSHGWYDLAPWAWDADRGVLARPVLLSTGRVAVVQVAQAGPGRGLVPGSPSPREAGLGRGLVPGSPSPREAGLGRGLGFRALARGRLTGAEAGEARAALATCLSLDEDLAPFRERAAALERERARGRRELPDLRWALARGAGRLLRSPTVFEDAVKTLCTTNCSWALTRLMVERLCASLGEEGPGGERAFPTAARMAAEPERFYRDTIRAGYRAPFLAALARDAASGVLDLEGLRGSDLPTDELLRRLRALRGFGPYAAEHLLRLLGHHDHLALDSWTRGKLARLRGRRRPPSDRTLRRWYAPYGAWAGLAMWLEVTADWHGASPSWP